MSETCDIYVTPISDALREFAQDVDIRETDAAGLLDFALENEIDLTLIVSQSAVNSNIAEVFNHNNIPIFGPTSASGFLMADKAYAKKVLYKLRIPTPKFGIFEKINMAQDYIKNQKIPFVLKTNDNKSALIFTSQLSAKNYVDKCFIEKNGKLIIEDYVYGTPFSFYTITDGYKALPIGSSIVYKHSLEGEGGQLTSGMGACSPNYKLSYEQEKYIMDSVIYPTLDYLEIEGNPYSGILGVSGIITEEGKISILGWNTFLQNCDAAAILENIDEDLYELFFACAIGSFSDEVNQIKLRDKYSVSVVLSCTNKNNKENVISGLDNLSESTIITMYPNLSKNKYLEWEASNGCLLGITATSSTITGAREKIYSEIDDIDFLGKFYRKDICTLPRI